MATSGVANRGQQHSLQIVQSIATYIISSDMSVFGVTVKRKNVEILCILTNNTPGGMATNRECSAMATTWQQMPNSLHAMFTKDAMCFDIFPSL
jgi:hypothetical protein